MRFGLCLAVVLSCTAARAQTAVVIDKESMDQQLAWIANEVAALRGRGADPTTQQRYNVLLTQLGELRRGLAGAPPVETPPQRPWKWKRDPGFAQPPQAIAEPMLRPILDKIRAEAFSNDKLMVLQQAAGGAWFLCAQVRQLLELYNFDNDKLRAAELLAPRILDKQNGYQLFDLFPFSSSKKKLQEILAR